MSNKQTLDLPILPLSSERNIPLPVFAGLRSKQRPLHSLINVPAKLVFLSIRCDCFGIQRKILSKISRSKKAQLIATITAIISYFTIIVML